MGSGAWVSHWSRGPPGCLIFKDLQTLHVPTNIQIEVCTQYRRFFLSLVDTFLLSRKFRGKERFVKNPEIGKNPEKSQACYFLT